ncbi:TPA: 16S rRNA (cytidine(1402)-2'-O)-methyltransferase [Clostridioides difficile]|nr:16S rRNA (cytidine(1402)-2'-O)-methyltransferase [Clostridioides difficile]
MGKIYVVATPIGNLSDITLRAIETLKAVDIIASEDTRRTLILLNKYNISTKLVAYHKFNEKEQATKLIELILQKDISIALVSDAGTPCISDPGSILISEALKNSIEVIPVPGVSSVIAALSVSGFKINNFTFIGFFPRANSEIKRLLNFIRQSLSEVYIIFESPKRIEKTLSILGNNFSDATVVLCNDLTKKFEKIYRGNILEVSNIVSNDENSNLGEYVLLLSPNFRSLTNVKDVGNKFCLESYIINEMVEKKIDAKEAIKSLSSRTSFKKNDLYQAMLNLKEIFGEKK